MKKYGIIVLLVLLSMSLFSKKDKKVEVDVSKIKGNSQTINMTVDRYGWHPNVFVVQKDIPVKWVIDGKDLNNCNESIQSKDLRLKFDLQKGKQVQRFVPKEIGEFKFTCWMDMIPGKFIVVDDLKRVNLKKIKQHAKIEVSKHVCTDKCDHKMEMKCEKCAAGTCDGNCKKEMKHKMLEMKDHKCDSSCNHEMSMKKHHKLKKDLKIECGKCAVGTCDGSCKKEMKHKMMEMKDHKCDASCDHEVEIKKTSKKSLKM